MFEQSIDWSDQISASLWWITWVFGVTAAVSLALVAALLRFTTWGRQFWRVSGAYFTGRASLPVWGCWPCCWCRWWPRCASTCC